ncbi:hypothetical protein AHiyo8_59130 [Arthrobacter sp. Hiyo8]|uniref:hypothetical protein n=1 Tax=Arthrobacter sp. Hiyo1 TaxID=1588020 RepID=UPI000683AF82|nr:hypothetical protein [Arthrobacter sp. Hiyo1]BAS17610.1 hypothetical protein AHiyo8_59130 [Arthrobacter sp. Hiyo8]GAP57968.1 hypothetical protein AHiyo1_09300 [Arthrobacter sp. Hiyo1]
MSDNDKFDGFDIAVAAFGIAGAVVVGYVVIHLLMGFGGWWNGLWTVTPKDTAYAEQQQKDWAKDPANPSVAGQKCLDMGGYPQYSAWDGRFLDCKGIGK